MCFWREAWCRSHIQVSVAEFQKALHTFLLFAHFCRFETFLAARSETRNKLICTRFRRKKQQLFPAKRDFQRTLVSWTWTAVQNAVLIRWISLRKYSAWASNWKTNYLNKKAPRVTWDISDMWRWWFFRVAGAAILGWLFQNEAHHPHRVSEQVLRPGHRGGDRPQRHHHGHGVLHDARGK